MAPRELELPAELLVADLVPAAQTLQQVGEIASRHGVDLAEPEGPRAGLMTAAADGQALSVSPDGRYELSLGEPNGSNAEPLSTEEAKSKATQLIGEHGLDRDVEIDFDSVRRTMAAGAAPDDGDREGPRVLETTIQFRQRINGLPVVSQHAGDVRITLDNDGRLTRIENTTRRVQQLSDRPKAVVAAPGTDSNGVRPRGGGEPEPLLAERLAKPQGAGSTGARDRRAGRAGARHDRGRLRPARQRGPPGGAPRGRGGLRRRHSQAL